MKILLILVLFNKSIANLKVLNSANKTNISRQDIFIYDNSLNPQFIPDIEGFNIIYQHNSNNVGVSKAYNIGQLHARELKCEAVILLDQDTDFHLDYLLTYKDAYLKYGDTYLYAPVICNADALKVYSPSQINNFVGKAQVLDDFNFSEKYNLNDKSVINSGLFVPMAVFDKIGGFNENIKLDFSDYYFIEKYKKINNILIILKLHIKHSISGDEGKNFYKELNRYKYYCNGAKELSISLKISVTWAPIRRLLRLILKYKSFKFISIYLKYYLQGKIV